MTVSGQTTIFLILATLIVSNSEYIPPGPTYPCPKETDNQLLFPCVCVKGTNSGLHVQCENTGLAVLSVGLGNIAGLGLPIEKLVLKECHISHLFGSLFHRSSIRVLHFQDTPLQSIDQYAFAGVNRTLQELRFTNTRLEEFPKDAFKILGNLSILSIDGHRMQKLSNDIFAGSEAAGRLEKLHLINGMIEEFAPETFQNLKKLRTLDLHGNRLGNLKRSQFKGLRDAEVLDISYNNITKLDGSHIGDLTKLGWCNASHNLIGEIPRGMFARNTILKVLHLDNNKIKKLDVNSFRGMRFLRRLHLQDNLISEVGRGTFSSLTRIGTVDLARNQIEKVDFQMFQAVKYAEIINLAENKIHTIESQAFTDLYQAVVNISHNGLTTIETNSFINCNNMSVLDLSHNNLTEISKRAFDENSYASVFDVTYNLFEDFAQIPIQNMTGIRVLNASYNKITNIPKLAFPKLYELHTVDLSHNELVEIANAVFQNLFSLRFLNLSHNLMETIKPATFGSVPTVLELDLSRNMLRDVSRGSLAKLASCRILDISHNHLEKIFQIPISLGELNFAYNNLSSINYNTWPTMNALLRLNLSNNNLEDRLAGDSFSGLLTLQALDLSHNGLTKPPWEALNTLSSLQYLYMQNNNLPSLSKSAFGHLPTLFHLDLSNNQLSSITPGAFNGMQQLIELMMRGNGLEAVPNEAFKGLVALRTLDLSHNRLEKIDNKTNGLLDDCLSLQKVDLSNNNIGFVTKKMFPYSQWYPYRLAEVDLSHNKIPVLTFDITIGGKSFKKLNLTGNIINDIRNNVLGNLTSLEVLDLSNNKLMNLISATSELKFNLPANITEIYLQNNMLTSLPTQKLIQSEKLKVLDVRYNQLSVLEPALVKAVKKRGLKVYFDGNNLHCDCFIRPLKHYLNQLSPSSLRASQIYHNLTCVQPATVENENLLNVVEERLLCVGNTELDGRIKEYGNTDGETDFDVEPDLVFRDVQSSQQAIMVQWFVKTTQDVADTYIYIRDSDNELLYTNTVSYNLRSLHIPVGSDLKTALQNGGKKQDSAKSDSEKGGNFEICIQGKSSKGFGRKWYKSQCQNLPSNFYSWPKKLNLDRRRLTKKNKPNNVLGLVSDSILITLCIFLGVCFRRLNDLDLG